MAETIETHGNGRELACPWCGEIMWMADDGRWARNGEDECEHCGKPFELSYDTSVYTTASRPAGGAEQGGGDGGN